MLKLIVDTIQMCTSLHFTNEFISIMMKSDEIPKFSPPLKTFIGLDIFFEAVSQKSTTGSSHALLWSVVWRRMEAVLINILPAEKPR